MTVASPTPPIRLQALPNSLPHDGAISLSLQEGAPVFRASQAVQERIQMLLDKQKREVLSPVEVEELDRYEAVDDYLSNLNRLVRNLLIQ